jgi:hypothetical protein
MNGDEVKDVEGCTPTVAHLNILPHSLLGQSGKLKINQDRW